MISRKLLAAKEHEEHILECYDLRNEKPTCKGGVVAGFIETNANRIDLPNEFLEEVCKRIADAAPVEEIHIFGSYARGEQRPDSDVDIFVATSNNDATHWSDNSHRIKTMIRPLLREIDKRFDLFCFSLKDYEKGKQRFGSPEYRIGTEGAKIYG